MSDFISQILEDNKNNVFFFSKDGCRYCHMLEKELGVLGITFTKYELEKMDEAYEAKTHFLKELTGMNTFPMLFFGDKLIGGYQDFQRLGATNQLAGEMAKLGVQFDEDF